jgi:hypothetical protein
MNASHDDFDEIDEVISSARASAIAKLDAATDFDAVLADIYAKAANAAASKPRVGPRDSAGEQGDAEAVGAQIDMLDAVLTAALDASERSPLMSTTYLTAARVSLRRLGRGLADRRLGKSEALRLIGHIEHNLREADRILRAQYGMSLDDALHRRIGELAELEGDIARHMRTLRQKITGLFDDAADPVALDPVPHG